jgi:hypothetical protein
MSEKILKKFLKNWKKLNKLKINLALLDQTEINEYIKRNQVLDIYKVVKSANRRLREARSHLTKSNQAKPLPRLDSDQIINSPSRPPAANR